MRLDFRNLNTLWASVLAETLFRVGVRHAVISPGSRSTPITIALAGHPGIEAIPVLDERSAAFFALGLSRQHGSPAVLVCTSGTAGANYFPAVIEASESGVPLLVITADRPPELRACASGQTIDQQRLFGNYPNFYHELAVPEASLSGLRYLRQMVAHAVRRAIDPFAGPVHLNAPLRDPLAPVEDGSAAVLDGAVDWDRFFSALGSPAQAPQPSDKAGAVPDFGLDVHGVIVAGPAQPSDPQAYAAAVGRIARALGWPVLADGISPVRHHADVVPGVVTAYDTILRNPESASALRPERVLCLGGWPASKVLRSWLEAADPLIWIATSRPGNQDGLHGRTRTLSAGVEAIAAAMPPGGEPGGYARLWAAHEQRARAELDGRIEAEPALFEPKAAWLLARHLPENTPFFVASSMPVRDVEYFWPAGSRRTRPFFNRGGNGIDGTLSTALGCAHGGRPGVLLTGDLALLHDCNGFLLRPRLRGSLTVVLINNRGGGIFEHLPVARFDPPFETFFATPQEADFRSLCAAYGAEHVPVRDWGHFSGLIADLPASGIRVLEIQTDRKRDAAGRRELFAAAAGI